jgi:hypothetical protein
MSALPAQSVFYGKIPPMPRKSPLFRPKRGKNTGKSIGKDHFSWNGEPKTKAM